MKKNAWLAILSALVLALGCLGAAQAEILAPYGEGQIGLTAVVLCESLTVRQKPSSSAKAVTTVHGGDHIIVQQQSGGWAECFLSDAEGEGPAGWVNTEYIAIDPAWYRTDASTPVYAWNDTAAPKVGMLDRNVILPILKDEGSWIIVGLRGAVGWIRVPNGTSRPDTKSSVALYYNPNGGSMYHLDPYCRSVSSKYLPLEGSFRYSQLNEPQYARLSPCQVCGAPQRED